MNELALSYDEAIDKIEQQMLEIGETDFETSGFFVGGMYVKTVVIPAGSFLTSRVHKQDHPFILSQGSMVIYTQDGGEQEITAPFIDITLKGTRRFAKALTDCLWTCVNRTNATTHEDAENDIVEPKRNFKLLKETA